MPTTPATYPGASSPASLPGNRGTGRPAIAAPGPLGRIRQTMPWALLLPAVIAMVLGAAAMGFRLDLQMADEVYAWEGHRWALRSALLTESLLHRLGREMSVAAWLILAAGWLWTWRRPQWRSARRPLGALLLSVLVSTATVAWIKSWSNMDCPWDLARYGGERAYIGLLAIRPDTMPHGGCFPAGHASAGYAWVALYFFFIAVRPAWRWQGLAAGLGLGLAFGISQQLRGAHFLSHDLWTFALCWIVAVAVHACMRLPLHAGNPP